MYRASNFKQIDNETFQMAIPETGDFKILQLTDLHLGFGTISRKKDEKALDAIKVVIEKSQPDMIVLTGDSVYPFLPSAGTMDNEMQAKKLLRFMDRFQIPYAFVMGNHDTEMGSKLNRKQLGNLFKRGRYAIFTEGPKDIFGVGNYCINLTKNDKLATTLLMLDSNMYGEGNFFEGFDCIHPDQTKWAMDKLESLFPLGNDGYALSFYHMPLREFKEAYEMMKMGDESIKYHFGTVGEKEDYFGISKYDCDFFEKAVENGRIKGMFCGHDHYNNISLTYKGIRMTYGMSIDCLGYIDIFKKEIQRGGTLITIKENNEFEVKPVPYTRMITTRVRGVKE